MLPLRLYLIALTLLFLFMSLATRGLGVLAGTVVVSSLVYLILDLREELAELKQFEAAVEVLSSSGRLDR